MDNLKMTPLFGAYDRYSGKVIDFAGWALPVQFEGIIPEHESVRNAAGLFDVSHMGEIEVRGNAAAAFVQYLVTNDVSTLADNQVMYAMMCYPDGGVVDDLLVYKFAEDYFYLVVNASNADKDFEWIKSSLGEYDAEIVNLSDSTAELALQGPKAEEILQRLTKTDLSGIKFFFCDRNVEVAGVKCLVSRTGYTGEDGFEIYMPNRHVEMLWDRILEEGRDLGLKPAGLGCRDTLRFEAVLPLYGNELSEKITPLEAGLGMFVKLDKGDFIGRDALLKQKTEGLKRKIAGFEMKDRGIPRHGYEVKADDKVIGFVTTGYFSPTLKKNIGLALIEAKYAEIGTEIEILVRNKPLKAEVIRKGFYRKNYKW
jgi:aminomethyltransferase